MSKYQEMWNKHIRGVGRKEASNFSQDTLHRIAREGGPIWTYEQDPHNTDAFKKGFEATFGKRDDIGSNLADKEK